MATSKLSTTSTILSKLQNRIADFKQKEIEELTSDQINDNQYLGIVK